MAPEGAFPQEGRARETDAPPDELAGAGNRTARQSRVSRRRRSGAAHRPGHAAHTRVTPEVLHAGVRALDSHLAARRGEQATAVRGSAGELVHLGHPGARGVDRRLPRERRRGRGSAAAESLRPPADQSEDLVHICHPPSAGHSCLDVWRDALDGVAAADPAAPGPSGGGRVPWVLCRRAVRRTRLVGLRPRLDASSLERTPSKRAPGIGLGRVPLRAVDPAWPIRRLDRLVGAQHGGVPGAHHLDLQQHRQERLRRGDGARRDEPRLDWPVPGLRSKWVSLSRAADQRADHGGRGRDHRGRMGTTNARPRQHA